MKFILIRMFLVATLFLISSCSLFESEPTVYGDEIRDPEAGVSPEIVSIGDTVYCDLTLSGTAWGFSWRIDEKPTGSNTIIQNIDEWDAFFIPDKFGVYYTTLVYNNGSQSFLNLGPFLVEVVNLRAFAGQDIEVDVGTNVSLDGSSSFGDQLTYLWSVLQSPQGANTQITNPTSVFASYLVDIGGDYFVELKVTDANQISDYDTLKITATDVPTGDIWTTLTDYPGEGTQGIIAISIGSLGYVGLGATTTNIIKKDFWEFDPSGNGGSGSWTQLSDFPANDTRDCAAFVLDNKIYVGLGSSANPVQTSQKFYVFDPSTNSWDDGNTVQLFPGAPRQNASTFVLDDEAYVGLGYQNSFPSQLFNDMYKYNTASNEWEPLNSFDGGGRYAAISFVLSNTAYIGYGIQTLASGYIDLWSYNKSSDTWTSVQPIQPLASSDIYYHSIGVATSTNGYLIGGGLQQTDNAKQVWSFNSSSWSRKTNSIAQLIYAAGFVINDKVYCGGGGNKKWYKYNPALDVTNKKFSITEANRNNKK